MTPEITRILKLDQSADNMLNSSSAPLANTSRAEQVGSSSWGVSMANMIVIACPQCDKQMKVPEALIGKKIRCKDLRSHVSGKEASRNSGGKQSGKQAQG